MAVSKEIIDAQLAALDEYNSFFTKKEINYLPEIILPGETIHAMTSGLMDGNTWLFVVTDQRIIMLDKGMVYGLKQLTLPLTQIKSVSHKSGLLLAKILIDTGGKTKTLENVDKHYAVGVVATINELLMQKTSGQTASVDEDHAHSDAMLAQLERLAALKEKGMLSDEEFAQAKAKLLA